MAHIERQKLLSITYTCDAPSCPEVLTGDVVQVGTRITEADFTTDKWRDERDARMRMLAIFHDTGWTHWAGRSSRYYCPDHAPKPGHKMCQIHPR